MTNAEFENIVEEAWERHHDVVRLRVKQPEDNNEFWFWVAKVAWERGYSAACRTMPVAIG